MAITISGENNNDRILASDGVIDSLSGFNVVGVITATSFTGDLTGDVTGNLTGNVTGNINNSTLLLQTGGYERLRIKSDGTITINSTGSQPSATVSGYQFDAVAATFRLGSGAGANGTTTSSISLMGSNHNSNIENGANSGAQMNLYNYNTNDGNSSAVSFLNSNSLAASRILGLNVSHSSRTGALVFMTSNGSHPTEKLRIDSDGHVTPAASGTQNLGSTSKEWGDVFS